MDMPTQGASGPELVLTPGGLIRYLYKDNLGL
jgi:hypothetical protein